MLSLTQCLNFELCEGCNLGLEHTLCPNRSEERFASLDTRQKLSDETIIDCSVKAYEQYNFVGLVGWHYYNEPLLEMDRMFSLMESIKSKADKARFILWTNGLYLPDDKSRFSAFDLIIMTAYQKYEYKDAKFHPKLYLWREQFDDRLFRKPALGNSPCVRPFVEIDFDVYGNHHPCCNDWRGESTLGNIHTDGFDTIVNKWRPFQENAFAGILPKGCQDCGTRYRDIQTIDQRSIGNIAQWIESKTL